MDRIGRNAGSPVALKLVTAGFAESGSQEDENNGALSDAAMQTNGNLLNHIYDGIVKEHDENLQQLQNGIPDADEPLNEQRAQAINRINADMVRRHDLELQRLLG